MARFHIGIFNDHKPGKALSKEELDAKHQAAMESKAIVSWKSPVTVYKSRNKSYFVKVVLYGAICILAAVAFGEFFLVGVVLAVMFVAFVLALSAPDTIAHSVTSMGIISAGKPFLWEELDSFWFDRRGDERLLVVQTYKNFPSRLIILLTTVSERTLLDILEKHIHYHPAPVHTLLDKWASSVQKRIHLD